MGVVTGAGGYLVAVIDVRTLARPLLASSFVVGGYRVLRNPRPLTPQAEQVGVPIANAVGLTNDPLTLVRINAGVQLGAGLLLALGRLPRVASLALAGTLVPTTLAGHRFWDERDPVKRRAETQQFLKNAGLLGGLLLCSLDTGGRPSVFWRGRRAASTAADAIGTAAGTIGTTASDLGGRIGHVGSSSHSFGDTAGAMASTLVTRAGELAAKVADAAGAFGESAADAVSHAAANLPSPSELARRR